MSPRKASIVAVAVASLVAAATPAAHAAAGARSYVVELKAAPLASYTGGRRGLSATSPLSTGARRLNTRSVAARAYSAFLTSRQDDALARVPGAAPNVEYSYRNAFAGFSAQLTQAQVAALRSSPQVARVFPDVKLKTDTTPAQANTLLDGATSPFIGDTAAYLGLVPTGLWTDPVENAGAGVVVGVIDTGITPTHPSFSATGFGPPPASWAGTCDTGSDSTFHCNNKLIGARFFVTGFGISHIAPGSFVSPRDDDGHGTHTASTAAGDFGVNPSIQGRALGVNRISGIAPGARVAAYKVCWVGGDVADGCLTSDSVAAIDAAVADGVDVINYSIGASTADLIDPVEVAFLGASDAGVFVATSAGNDGPDASTVGTPTSAPWVTAVAADNPARTFLGSATIDGGVGTISGASVTAALPAAQIVDSANSAAAGQTAADAELCFPGSLSSAAVTGKIVLCKRGVNPRIEKSKVVKDAGGVGMILYNADPAQDTDTDIHYVPAIHVSNADGLKVKNAIAAGATHVTAATAGTAVHGTPAVLAAFSSRGPQTPAPDIAKPDVTAPGVNILAGNTPSPAANTGLPTGELFQSISGTSMSSPQVAGAGALIKQAHPNWSPAEIKSALMTTADPSVKLEDGATQATPFDMGSGEIDPTKAAAPGLVFDVTTNDYLRYLDALDPTIVGDGQAPIAPADLNLPSIANSKVAGTFSTTRTVTSVDGSARHWDVSISVPGFSASVSPSAFDIGPGATQQLTVNGQAAGAPLDQYAFGAMTLTSGATTLRVPVSLRPIAVSSPETVKVTAAQSDGSTTIPLKSGLNGTLTGLGWGLAAPSTHAGEQIQTDAAGAPDPANGSASMKFYDVTVPAGAQLLSGRISNADGDADPNTDLDLYLFRDANNDGAFTLDELVDQSASAIADEGVTEVLPEAGHYRFVVVGFATRSPSTYDFTTWLDADGAPDDTSGGPGISVTGDPFNVSIGQSLAATLNYAHVDHKGLYLGLATFHDSGSPALSNVKGSSVIELTKTAETTSPAAVAGGGPAAGASKSKPKARALAVSRLRASLRRGRLSLTVTLTRKAALTVRIRRGSKVVFKASRRGVPAGRHVLHLRVGRRLHHKRTYRITVTATLASKHVRRTLSFRVR